MIKFAILLFLFLLSDVIQGQAVNPCIALKLPFCKVNQDFAEEHGIPKPAEEEPPVRRPTLNRVTPDETRRPTLNRVKSDETSAFERPKPSFVRPPRPQVEPQVDNDRDNSACAGLIFCKLSKDVPKSERRPVAPVTEAASFPDPPEVFSFFDEDLMSAVLNGHLETAEQLIEDGADVNQEDVHGNSVLHIAAQNGRTDIIETLLLKGADVNKGNNHRNTALHLAAQNGWTDIAEILLKHKKIDVDFMDLHANTALHLAAQNGQIGVTRHLLEANATVNQHNSHKHTPLHLAAQNGHLALSKMLVDAGANLNAQDLIGNTPLHTAVHTTHNEIAQMLIRNGADPQKRNLSGLTPFQLG